MKLILPSNSIVPEARLHSLRNIFLCAVFNAACNWELVVIYAGCKQMMVIII